VGNVAVIPKAKKRKKSDRRKDEEACDKLFSLITRSIGMCESGRLDHKGNLQCAHGISRSYKPIRWDPRNAWCLCAGCHVFYTLRPLEWDEWLHERWGEALYGEMRQTALGGVRPDMKVLRAELVQMWKQIDGG